MIFESPATLATKYGFHRATINRWVNEGKLRAYKTPGGRLKIKEADFRLLLGLEDEAAQ